MLTPRLPLYFFRLDEEKICYRNVAATHDHQTKGEFVKFTTRSRQLAKQWLHCIDI